MIDLQKFRSNFYKQKPKELFMLSRLLGERNWFVRPVREINRAIYGAGFQFASQEAREWVKPKDSLPVYDFTGLHADLLAEYLTSDAVVALWRKRTPSGRFPVVEVPHLEHLEYTCVAGVRKLSVTLERVTGLKDSDRERYGDKLFTALKSGKKLELDDEDDEWAFEVFKSGKRNSPFGPPSVTAILDDLDFIEAIKVGDWNGAWARREILRLTKKGYSTSSGQNAGRTTNHAKTGELKAIQKAMKEIFGKADIVSNFDQDTAWLTFPPEFFKHEALVGPVSRMLHWAGFAGVLLMQTEAKITGISPALMKRLRDQVLEFRKGFGEFLARIFNSESFRNGQDVPYLEPTWSQQALYLPKEFTEWLSYAATNGLMSPPTQREMLDLDDTRESERMAEAHKHRANYTPPFEPRQGLVTALFPDDFKGTPAKPGAEEPGDPGRPSGA